MFHLKANSLEFLLNLLSYRFLLLILNSVWMWISILFLIIRIISCCEFLYLLAVEFGHLFLTIIYEKKQINKNFFLATSKNSPSDNTLFSCLSSPSSDNTLRNIRKQISIISVFFFLTSFLSPLSCYIFTCSFRFSQYFPCETISRKL